MSGRRRPAGHRAAAPGPAGRGPGRWARWSLWPLRLVIGGVVLAAGLGKALDLAGFVPVLASYRLVPPAGRWPAAVGVTAAEVLIGLWVLSGRSLSLAALAATAMHLGYAAIMATALARGLDIPNCGCFGVFLARPLRWFSPLEDLVAAALSLALYRLAAGARVSAAPARAGSSRVRNRAQS